MYIGTGNKKLRKFILKIRTLTFFFPFEKATLQNSFDIFNCLQKAAHKLLLENSIEIQTFRIATNVFASASNDKVIEFSEELEQICKNREISFCSLGMALEKSKIEKIPKILEKTSSIFCSAFLGDSQNGLSDTIETIAEVIKKNSHIHPQGLANFRFAAMSNPVLTPFFPVASAEKKTGFAIGFENSEMLFRAFQKKNSLESFQTKLAVMLQNEYSKIEKIMFRISEESGIHYFGMDTSINPSVTNQESIAFAFEKFLNVQFGEAGTLAVASAITSVLKNVAVKRIGYCGLMLPVLEDYGLAEYAKENRLNISKLLLFSSVCGTGIDCVPLAGNISLGKLEWLLRDVAQMSIRLQKPLSVRVFPIPEKQQGDLTEFDSPYLVNTNVFSL